tara:strand:+ start:322 stop:570 length:249 start_codon:yes stop_codon:yes gene_type:complete
MSTKSWHSLEKTLTRASETGHDRYYRDAYYQIFGFLSVVCRQGNGPNLYSPEIKDLFRTMDKMDKKQQKLRDERYNKIFGKV